MTRFDRQGAILRLVQERPLSTQAELAAALEQGLVVLTAGEHVLRLAPPLVVGADEVDTALTILEEIL